MKNKDAAILVDLIIVITTGTLLLAKSEGASDVTQSGIFISITLWAIFSFYLRLE